MRLHKIMRLVAAAGLMAGAAGMAQAESSFQSGTGSLTATAHLDFQITVPQVLYLRVGTAPAGYATGSTVDLISFTVPAANVGDGTVVAATATSGDLGNGTVTARVMGNGGNVTFTSTTTGAISDGNGDTVSFSKLAVSSAVNTSTTALPHPTFVDGGVSSALTLTATNHVVNQDAKWTFTYLNNSILGAGTYGGVNTNNSRVTYTAVMP